MVDPDGILYIPGDMTALADHADAIRAAGVGFAATGEQIHATWQSLAAVYRAPEADQLLAATGPVKAVSASAGEDIQAAAAALTEYAVDVALIQARLDDLRGRATALQGDIATATATAAYEGITSHPTLDAGEAELSASIAAEVAAWEAAQRRCAAKLRAVSTPSPLVGITSVLQGSPFAALVQNHGETLRTPIAPRGPIAEILPSDSGAVHPGGIGFIPFITGPEVLVNIPGPRPPPTPGPGGLQPALGPLLDRNSSATDGRFERPTAGKVEPPGLPPAEELIASGQLYLGRKLPNQAGPPNGVLYKRNQQTGELTNYILYDEKGNAIKRVDISGRSHGGVSTPHVSYYADNTSPGGRTYTQEIDWVRAATPEEVP